MARKTYAELITQANETLLDNTTGLISAEDVRDMFMEFLNTTMPAYGFLRSLPEQTLSSTPTPSLFLWTEDGDTDGNFTTSNAASGSIEMAEKGAARITFNCNVALDNRDTIAFALLANGVRTSFASTLTGSGDGQYYGLTFSAFHYGNVPQTYAIEYWSDVNTSFDIGEATLIAKIEPVSNDVSLMNLWV